MTRKEFDERLQQIIASAVEMGLWKGGLFKDHARVILAVRRQVAMSPKLRECTPESIARAALDAHLAGLMPDGHEGYLVPRWNKKLGRYEAHFQASWRGAQAVACEDSDFRSVTAEVVREEDDFTWTAGLSPTLEHVPELNSDSEIIACYAVGFPRDVSPPLFVVCDKADIAAARDTGGPTWQTHPAAMARKTAVFRLTDRVIPKKTARARLAALTVAEGRLHEIGTSEAGEDRAARLMSAIAVDVDPGTGEVLDDPAGEIAPPNLLAEEFNKKLTEYRTEGANGGKYADLQDQAKAAGLEFDTTSGQYRRINDR